MMQTEQQLTAGGLALALICAASAARADDGDAFSGIFMGIGAGYSHVSSDAAPSALLSGFGLTVPSGGNDGAGVRVEANVLGMKNLGGNFYGGVNLSAFWDGAEASGDCDSTGQAAGAGLTLNCTSGEAFGGSAQLRVGYDISGVLLYGQGGLVAASYDSSVTLGNGGPVSLTVEESGVETGWTAGGGFMAPITEAVMLDLTAAYEDYGDRDTAVFGIPVANQDRRGFNIRAGMAVKF